MKNLYILAASVLLFGSCTTDDATPLQTTPQPVIQVPDTLIIEVPVIGECAAYKAEIDRNYNELLEIYITQHPDPQLSEIIRMHHERMDYLQNACEFIED